MSCEVFIPTTVPESVLDESRRQSYAEPINPCIADLQAKAAQRELDELRLGRVRDVDLENAIDPYKL